MAKNPAPKAGLLIGGFDAHYPHPDHQIACLVTLTFPEGRFMEAVYHNNPSPYPYKPGAFYKREGPAILTLFQRLHKKPDILLVDGHGRLHPQNYGIACWAGESLSIPTIGVAKSPLVGNWEKTPIQKGKWEPIRVDGRVQGALVCTRSHCRPLFVSVGWGLTLPEAIEIVVASCKSYRSPEPLRQAHHRAKMARHNLLRDV